MVARAVAMAEVAVLHADLVMAVLNKIVMVFTNALESDDIPSVGPEHFIHEAEVTCLSHVVKALPIVVDDPPILGNIHLRLGM